MSAKRGVQLVGLVGAVLAVVAVVFLPAYSEVSTASGAGEHSSRRTILDVNGVWYLLVLAIPLVLAALPLPARGRAWQPLSIVSAVLLVGWVFLGMASIGWYFVPSAIAAIVAAWMPPRRASGHSPS